MRLTIVYDNTVYRTGVGLQSRWGFSCLVETEEDCLLFDTGGDGDVLLHNMSILDVQLESIDAIVVSHEHWDHAGGLAMVLEHTPDVTVYRLESAASYAENTVVVDDPCRIADGVYSTGRLSGSPVDEQSLLLRCGERWYVLTGCSHPGVAAILEAAGEHGRVDGIIGGLHGFDRYRLLEGMSLVCPTHCTRHIGQIRQRFHVQHVEGGVGRVISLEPGTNV
ncbi:MAG: MBL fold metallo-hydrolase [Thermoplasmatota archaeon]